MEDDKNYRDYRDFFNQKNRSDESKEQELPREAQDPIETRDTAYYSYGPFKTTATSDSGETSDVEVAAPKNLTDYKSDQVPNVPQYKSSWSYNGPSQRRFSFKSFVASFLAGALVVGSLMFASDRMNLFSADQAVMNNGNSVSAVKNTPASGNGAVKNTALDVVRPNNIAQIAESASPAVVKIETLVRSSGRSGGGSPFLDDPFFRQFFGDNFFGENSDNNDGRLRPGGMGSGFIFEESGYILTNEHVVDGASEIQVTVQGYDKPFKAKLLGNSYELDLAALKIEGDSPFPTLKIGNADNLNVGDWVVAIGNPYGFDHTVTVGVLSAKERPISIPDSQGTREYEHLLQTDASINPGNSGGPLLNLNGEVVGINTAVSSQAQGIGFAIPTGTISSVLDNLKNNVKIPKEPEPYIGVGLQDIDKSWVKELKLDNTKGSIVTQVEVNSPAYKAGIRTYDVILELNGKEVADTQALIDKVKASKIDDRLTVTVSRDGKKLEMAVIVGNRNAEE